MTKITAKMHKCEWIGANLAEAYTCEIQLESENIKSRVKELQELVGGYFDVVRYKDKLLYVDDEGLLKNKPLNPWATERGLHLVGTIIEVNASDDT